MQAILAADMVVIMDKGQVKWVGSPADCSSSSYASFVRPEELGVSSETETKVETGDTCMGVLATVVVESECIDIMDVTDNIIMFEERKEGRVETTVYK